MGWTQGRGADVNGRAAYSVDFADRDEALPSAVVAPEVLQHSQACVVGRAPRRTTLSAAEQLSHGGSFFLLAAIFCRRWRRCRNQPLRSRSCDQGCDLV